jgi:glyoxylase-like metal-dependent hydrolase (beta-lactamase superfamily II)
MADHKVIVGNVEITSLSDGILEFDLCNFYPSIPENNWTRYPDDVTSDHKISLNLASYLIRSQGHTIIVDTGLGPVPEDAPDSPWGKLIHNFEATGVRLDEVETVVLTHLHRDHIGWNMTSENGKHKPIFPNARYVLSRKDWEATHVAEYSERFPNANSQVWPLEELGILDIVENEHPISGELTTLPTPGHTPGHMSILISSQGQKAIVLGDALHSPAQVQEWEWCSRADMDPDQSRLTRRTLMERLEGDGSLVAAGHFPPPGFGKIVRLEDRRYWQAL